ncbi:hypothetical protein ANN_12714 [Periplaneta americana]|uniref:Uncharacterized protein n=1 Tax=Periplaneta americana TaxID=6978 RepID=A0ABQ8TJI3_PERAM|nr:hypothetical protein ANN_12714 [Periplaneta americana]
MTGLYGNWGRAVCSLTKRTHDNVSDSLRVEMVACQSLETGPEPATDRKLVNMDKGNRQVTDVLPHLAFTALTNFHTQICLTSRCSGIDLPRLHHTCTLPIELAT